VSRDLAACGADYSEGNTYRWYGCEADSMSLRIVIPHYGEEFPDDPGYRALRYGRFAERWTEEGHDVIRVGPSFSHLRRSGRPVGILTSCEGAAVIVSTIGYHNTRSLRRLLFLIQFLTRSALAVRRLKPDVVLLGYPPPLQLWLLRLVGVSAPIVFDVRDLWFDHRNIQLSFPERVMISVLSRASRFEINRADGLVTLSDDMADWVGGDEDVVSVVPIGVSNLGDVTGSRQEGPARCVFVGTLNSHFRLDEVINTWPVHSRAPQLLIAGDGPKRLELTRLSNSNSNIEMLGPVPSEAVPELLRSCDIGIAPTTSGFGTVLSNKVCEYLSAGLFVVHSLEDGPARDLARLGFGTKVQPNERIDWSKINLEELRETREARRNTAVLALGADEAAVRVLSSLRRAVNHETRIGGGLGQTARSFLERVRKVTIRAKRPRG